MNTSERFTANQDNHRVRQRAIRWYTDPDYIPLARKHDSHVEIRYSKFMAEQIADLKISSPRVLDVGCGEALLAAQLENYEEYIGVDPDPSDIHSAFETHSQTVRFIRAGVEEIPQTIPPVDVIASSLNIALWDDAFKRCTGLRKLVKPGGRILIVDLLRDSKRIERSPKDKLDLFLIDQFNASLTIQDVERICEESLPGAEYTILSDDRTKIVPSIDSTTNYGHLFCISYKEGQACQ